MRVNLKLSFGDDFKLVLIVVGNDSFPKRNGRLGNAERRSQLNLGAEKMDSFVVAHGELSPQQYCPVNSVSHYFVGMPTRAREFKKPEAKPGTVGYLIWQTRAHKGWTQVYLSKKSGISQPQISEIENGRTTEHMAATVESLAAALELRVEQLMQTAQATAPLEGSAAAVKLAGLFDRLEKSTRAAAWPWLVRLLAHDRDLLEANLSFPDAEERAPAPQQAAQQSFESREAIKGLAVKTNTESTGDDDETRARRDPDESGHPASQTSRRPKTKTKRKLGSKNRAVGSSSKRKSATA